MEHIPFFYRVFSTIPGGCWGFRNHQQYHLFPFPHDFLLPNFPFDHAALHGAGRSLWPTAAPKRTSTTSHGPYESITKKKDHPGQIRSPVEAISQNQSTKTTAFTCGDRLKFLHVSMTMVGLKMIEGVPWLATVLNTMEVWGIATQHRHALGRYLDDT